LSLPQSESSSLIKDVWDKMRAAESSSENKRPALKYEKVREPTMTKLEKVLYTAKAYTFGRGGGASRTENGQSAIFLSVTKTCRQQKEGQVAGRSGHRRRSGLGHDRRGLRPRGRLNVSLPGIEREVAQELVDAAEQLRGLR
jgi:hypothetical protein